VLLDCGPGFGGVGPEIVEDGGDGGCEFVAAAS
jgi:hypothetical protein